MENIIDNVFELVECKGFTKEEAFKNLDFVPNAELIKGTNCTQAWILEGKPTPGTRAFQNFAMQQLELKTKMKPGYGLYIVMDNCIPDTRKRPYTIISPKVTATRHWSTIMYMVVEAELDIKGVVEENGEEIEAEDAKIEVVKRNAVISLCESLDIAKKKMKDLTTLTHKNYIAMAVKVPDIFPEAAYSIYTPSKMAKLGTFLAFGIGTTKL